ncbi:helix-turn-helix transcriptional regulator [Acuticoccus sp. MNP-M23]|uniref:helix-turn-helix domain-containing protein n=1 Tax=Acuticoccus sp. MNP-M23 TaxID=3072793 RepID=UPI002814C7ED|nr:helix-turn-helix transcriptional regulator [Acuticoccus sp. MNP-M23]WMS40786.1 helix-turn-helix transcriptional regulator [Acuticoccus sp. MNP-M23]
MTPEQFRAWRKANGWKQRELADRLGLKRRMIQYYERGNRDGKDVEIPRTVRLACYAIACGVEEFDGRTVQWAMHTEEDLDTTPADEDDDD